MCFFRITNIYYILGSFIERIKHLKKLAEQSLLNYIHILNLLSLRLLIIMVALSVQQLSTSEQFANFSTHSTKFSSQFYKQRIVCKNYSIYSLKN